MWRAVAIWTSSQNYSIHRSKVPSFEISLQIFDSDPQGGIRKPLTGCCCFFFLEEPRKRCQSRWCKNEADSEIPNPFRNFSNKQTGHPINSHLEVPGGRAAYIKASKNPWYDQREANPDSNLLQCKNIWLLVEKWKTQRQSNKILRDKSWRVGTRQCKLETWPPSVENLSYLMHAFPSF